MQDKLLSNARFHFHDDVLHGLKTRPASIPPKYFYDSKGSQLFDAITELPEYYQTRTETSILQNNASEIANYIDTGSLLIEPGGGSCEKVQLLLKTIKPIAYVPMDISKQHLQLAAKKLALSFPELDIHAICTDFTQAMVLPLGIPESTRVVFFPGSSIGNFDPKSAITFLHSIARLIKPKGYLLIGVDLKKDNTMLHSAYNDSAGITAQFNLNLLQRINNELKADFDITNWAHKAFYNEQKGRIEMHLVSQCDQSITIGSNEFKFTQGETIHSENSYKYTSPEFITLAQHAGLQSLAVWHDKNNLFSVHLLQA